MLDFYYFPSHGIETGTMQEDTNLQFLVFVGNTQNTKYFALFENKKPNCRYLSVRQYPRSSSSNSTFHQIDFIKENYCIIKKSSWHGCHTNPKHESTLMFVIDGNGIEHVGSKMSLGTI